MAARSTEDLAETLRAAVEYAKKYAMEKEPPRKPRARKPRAQKPPGDLFYEWGSYCCVECHMMLAVVRAPSTHLFHGKTHQGHRCSLIGRRYKIPKVYLEAYE